MLQWGWVGGHEAWQVGVALGWYDRVMPGTLCFGWFMFWAWVTFLETQDYFLLHSFTWQIGEYLQGHTASLMETLSGAGHTEADTPACAPGHSEVSG